MPRFRTDSAPVPPRRFKLPEGEHATAPALPELYTPVKAPEWGAGTPRETYKRTSRRPVEAQMAAGGLYTARAPVAPRKGRRILEFTAATNAPMQAFMGTLALRIDRGSVDLGRLELGIMSLAIDHDTAKLLGRITEATVYPGQLDMRAEISNTATATEAMAEVDDLTRAGISPGFLIHETEVIDADHADYDEDQMFQIEVTRWEPYEISSTAIPRNPNAKLKGVASMSNVIAMDDGKIMDAPEILNREDVIGLSLAAGREVLASGQGSERQRAKLEEFFKVFEAGRKRGLSRDVAAQAAKAVAGI